jgi:tetratricopeptide (TPR) repeat protein
MEFSAEHIELFDAYISDNLNADERQSFEERINNDAKFKSEFDAFKQFELDIVDSEVTAFKAQLSKWDEALPENLPSKGRIIPFNMIGIAATFVVILVASLLYFTQASNPQDLVAANFTPYDNILTVRGEKEDLDDALVHYEAQEYEAAIEIFEQYPNNVNAQFYIGESHLALKKYEAAIPHFKAVLKLDGLFNEVAEYHLALAYFGNDNSLDGKEMLMGIDETSDYFKPAQAILEDLE